VTTVQAPGSSANLGPGFDALGVAITLYARVSDHGTGSPCPAGSITRVAYETAGGQGDIWLDFDLPPGRGLGFSGAARAAAAVLAAYQRTGSLERARDEAYPVVARLEGHGDNAAPSVFGGVQLVAGPVVHRVPRRLQAELVIWVPDAETLTEESRACLRPTVERGDAVFNLGRTALLVCALAEDRPDLLRTATEDRLHQPARLAASTPSRRALAAALDAGALGAWLSGSGPSVAAVVHPGQVEQVIRALPPGGEALVVDVDEAGAVLTCR
jgi:homoserine kinase